MSQAWIFHSFLPSFFLKLFTAPWEGPYVLGLGFHTVHGDYVGRGGIESLISEHDVGEEINSVSIQTRTYFLPPHSPALSQDPATLSHLKNPKDEQGWARRGGSRGQRRGRRGGPLMSLPLKMSAPSLSFPDVQLSGSYDLRLFLHPTLLSHSSVAFRSLSCRWVMPLPSSSSSVIWMPSLFPDTCHQPVCVSLLPVPLPSPFLFF